MAELIYFKDILSLKSKEKTVSKKRIERSTLKAPKSHKVLTAYLMERKKENPRR